jgi:HlyD family secretion protein
LAAVLVAALVVFFKGKTPVEKYTVKPINVDYTILSSCTVSDPKPYDIFPAIEGEVKVCFVKEGEEVKKDRVLLQLDDFKERQNLNIAMSNLEALQLKVTNASEELEPRLNEQLNQDLAALEEAKNRLERIKRLEAGGSSSKAELEKTEADAKQAQARYNQTKIQHESFKKTGSGADLKAQLKALASQVELAKKSVQDKIITAPYDGIITKIEVKTGENVRLKAPIITLIEKRNWILEANVDQKELPYLAGGLPAYFMLDAYPGEKIKAEVYFVCASIDLSKGSCNLRIEVKENRPFIKYGMTGSVEIAAKKYKDVLAVPLNFTQRSGTETYVFVEEKSGVKKLKLEYFAIGEKWLIAKNLAQGAVLCLPPAGK